MRGVGHMSLPIDRRIVRDITATLAHLDSDGATVTAGVTRLERSTGDETTSETDSMPNRLRSRLRVRRSARG